MRRKESHIPIPPKSVHKSRLQRVAAFPFRLARSYASLLAGAACGLPGYGVHLRGQRLAASLLVRQSDLRDYATNLILEPLDCVRYFELDFAWKCTKKLPGELRYLDVSSPRLLPALLVSAQPRWRAELLNPDGEDLALTRRVFEGLGIDKNCHFMNTPLSSNQLEDGAYDLITCISVVEHIPTPDDIEAVKTLLRALKPGGTLVLTVPVAKEAFEEWLDLNPYGLHSPDDRGWYFGQRFYDESTLTTLIGNSGATRIEYWGEKQAGLFFADREMKILGQRLPEAEPWRVAREWSPYPSVSQLPGIGVAAVAIERPLTAVG